jgi:hypothetical protein
MFTGKVFECVRSDTVRREKERSATAPGKIARHLRNSG